MIQALPDQITACAWQTGFEAWLTETGRAGKTRAAYRSDLALYARWFAGVNQQPFTLDLLTSVDLRAYRAHSLEQERVAPSTWNRRRAALAMLCRYAREIGAISYDPLSGVLPKEKNGTGPRWLERADQNRILRQLERNLNAARTPAAYAQAARDQAMVFLMLHAGLREAEVVDLDWSDLALCPRSGQAVIRKGKGDKERKVPLSAEARRALAAWSAVADPFGGGGPVFTGKGSTRLTTRQVQRRVGQIGRQAGVQVTPHQLRHSFAKRLVDERQPLTLVQDLLGHSRLDTTAVYVKPGWRDLERAVENL